MEKFREDLTPVDVWVTPNVAIYRQLTMWDAKTKEFHFVVATSVGAVIVTAHNSLMNCAVMRGFVLNRPAGLSLSWYCDKTINFRVLSISAAAKWQSLREEPWKALVSSNRY